MKFQGLDEVAVCTRPFAGALGKSCLTCSNDDLRPLGGKGYSALRHPVDNMACFGVPATGEVGRDRISGPGCE